jgi:hypothetical protein
MPVRIFVPWLVLAAVLSFVLGGSFHFLVWGEPHNDTRHYAPNTEQADGRPATPGNKSQATPEQAQEHHNRDLWGPEWFLVWGSGPLAIFTGLLFYYTRKLAADAARIARDEFLATHRPWLRVRYFKRIELGSNEAIIRFSVVNIGDTEARMFQCRANRNGSTQRDCRPSLISQ